MTCLQIYLSICLIKCVVESFFWIGYVICLVLLDIFFEILTLFMHHFSDFSEPLYACYPELSGESLISISLKSISGIWVIWNIVCCFFSFLVCVGFCTLDKTAISPSLNRVVFCRRSTAEELFQSAQPKLLFASQTFMVVQATFFVLGAS